MTDDALIGPVGPPDLHVMTYNIRRRIARLNPRSRDLWSRRKWLVRRLLASEQPAVLGVQEAMPDQVKFVADSLGPSYRSLGYGRNADREGERCVIFYDSRRVEVAEWHQLALSDTPEVSGSRSWGNMVPRVVVWARFTDTATGARFRVFNTHFDHLSGRSRLRSAKMLNTLVAGGGGAAVIMGDANAGASTRSRPYSELTEEGGLADAWLVADKRLTPPWGTFSGYRRPRRGGRRIDWLLVSRGIRVRAAAINAVRYEGGAASDHEPVQALLQFDADGDQPARAPMKLPHVVP